MKKANYRPNAIARSLSTSKSSSVGVFIHFHPSRGLHQMFFQEVLFSLEINLGKRGYDFVYFSDLKWQKTCDYLEKCLNRHIDGAILMGISNDENLHELLESDIPVVILDLDITAKNATYITSDNLTGAKMAVNYLYELGHRNVGMIAGEDTFPSQCRSRGFREEIARLGMCTKEKWIAAETSFNEEGGYREMKKILKQKELPTAFFCHSDMIAIGAMKAIQDAGYSVPGDFSIIGFDDLEISSIINPALTTIKQDTYLMGNMAADILFKMMKENERETEPLVLPVELVKRESCRAI
ncbi:MAG: LacI family transcriptional regulator [Halanaerobiaceae bacterium]|nr:LacI family transcriptional regulator [Halanaerobiaceae bacterium]